MIIIPILQDPTDIVIQGEVIGDASVMDWQLALAKSVKVFDSTNLFPIIQGEVIGSKVMDSPVPFAMIGQHDWYGIKPRQTGPKVMSGGELVMLDIGKKPVDVFVDSIQRWLSSVFQMDSTGFMLTLYDANTIGAPEAIAQFMIQEPETMGNPVVTIPRGAVYRSGLIKRITVPILPNSFGRHTNMDSFTDSTRKFFLTGVTKDGAGNPLGNCRVVILPSIKIIVWWQSSANPVLADLVSDGSGNYSFQVPNNSTYQVMAYKVGSPDLAGVTVMVVPTEV